MPGEARRDNSLSDQGGVTGICVGDGDKATADNPTGWHLSTLLAFVGRIGVGGRYATVKRKWSRCLFSLCVTSGGHAEAT